MAKSAFIYEVQPRAGAKPQRGELIARDIADARRKLRGLMGVLRLPPDTKLTPKEAIVKQAAAVKSAKLRYLLHMLSEHHEWLKGKGDGQRANLSRLNLSGVNLSKKNLSHADLAEADLSKADLSGANLASANLVRAILRDANLNKANLSGADLSETDLRGADLLSSKLSGADLWRANLKGCVISPKALHGALDCRSK